MDTPNPFNNPTLEGFDILQTSPVIEGVFGRSHRALVCRYSDPAHGDRSVWNDAHGEWQKAETFVLWQEADRDTGEFFVIPGSNTTNCEALIKVLLATKEA